MDRNLLSLGSRSRSFASRAFVAMAATALLVACGGGAHLLPQANGALDEAQGVSQGFDSSESSFPSLYDDGQPDGKGGTVTVSLSIKVPAHKPLHGHPKPLDDDENVDVSAPDWTSPGTEGLGVTVTTKGSKKKVTAFWKLSKKTKGCTLNKKSKVLTCELELANVPVGKDTFLINGYGYTSKKSAIVESGKLTTTIKSTGKHKLKLSLNGDIKYEILSLCDAYPPIGTPATICVNVLATDAWGYIIIGNYADPIVLSDPDKSGATHFSSTVIKSSKGLATLTLSYGGATLAPTVLMASSKSTKFKGLALFAPGSAGISVDPPGLLLQLGAPPSQVTLAGPGTVLPFNITTGVDAFKDPACGTLVKVAMVSSNVFTVAAAAAGYGACSLNVTDSGGHAATLPVILQPEPSPSGNPSPTPTPPSNANSVVVSPSNAVVCQQNNSGCTTTTMTLTVSQNAFVGSFTGLTTCPPSIATLTPASAAGPSATFKVTGGKATGACTATFVGGGGKSTTIVVTTTGANTNNVIASPATVTICPSSGTASCSPDSKTVAVSQVGYVGAFGQSNTCEPNVAVITPVSEVAPSGSYTVTGRSTTGTCQMNIYGAGGKAAVVDIDVEAAGTVPIIANPTAITVCPSGCSPNTQAVTISETGYTGAFQLQSTCASARATISPTTPGQTNGPSASYTITGGTSQGRCTATWTDTGNQQVVVTIDVTSSGWIIDTVHSPHR